MPLNIADYALLSDCQSSALVGIDGSIDWWCVPRFDSPSNFARILDPDAGHCSLRPIETYSTTRNYLEKTMVVETTFKTETGTVRITDAIGLGPHETGHQIGLQSTNTIFRTARCTEGAVTMRFELAPRPEYGAILAQTEAVKGGAVLRGGAERFQLSASIPIHCTPHTVAAEFTLHKGRSAEFALQRADAASPAPKILHASDIRRGMDDTVRGWRSWAEMHVEFRGAYEHEVHASGRILQAMTYQPTGAIVAAMTTSLPEFVGGELNWDYRYCWMRDASFTMDALWIAACPDEGERYFKWLAGSSVQRRDSDHIQVMLGIMGNHDIDERTVPMLAGFKDSRPVRIGNAAWTQRQNDVYGAIVGAAYCFRDSFESLDDISKAFIIRAIEEAKSFWMLSDSGMWETRGPEQRFTHSAFACWLALTKGAKLAQALGVEERAQEWLQVAAEIATVIRNNAWSAERQSYTQVFGGSKLDATALLLITNAFVPADDPQALATVKAIETALLDSNGFLRRYETEDDKENAFILCTFWLAEAWAALGQTQKAREIVDRVLARANDVGLLSEEIDSRTGDMIGNFPQGFSHIGLVNAAYAITRAETR